jgi:hypothetical protein
VVPGYLHFVPQLAPDASLNTYLDARLMLFPPERKYSEQFFLEKCVCHESLSVVRDAHLDAVLRDDQVHAAALHLIQGSPIILNS